MSKDAISELAQHLPGRSTETIHHKAVHLRREDDQDPGVIAALRRLHQEHYGTVTGPQPSQAPVRSQVQQHSVQTGIAPATASASTRSKLPNLNAENTSLDPARFDHALVDPASFKPGADVDFTVFTRFNQ